MNPRLATGLAVLLILIIFGGRFIKVIPPGHVGVAILFGSVQDEPLPEGFHVVNPLLSWETYDVRQKTLKESALVPTRDQLQTKLDVSVQYRLVASMTPRILQNTGRAEQMRDIHLIPTLRSMVREQGATIKNAEDFFNADTRRQLETGLLSQLQARLNAKGFEIQDVLVRDISLPQVLSKAIEMKKEREQAVERQKAELERFRTEQLQKVALAEAERKAAEEESEKRIILAKARAFEIREINKAVASNPAYIQLQALEALKAMSKDPAAKIYFMDGSSNNPLPLLHMGDRN
jgi:regulator of protease activity HflC (stomatin/prohibitin superfamily)